MNQKLLTSRRKSRYVKRKSDTFDRYIRLLNIVSFWQKYMYLWLWVYPPTPAIFPKCIKVLSQILLQPMYIWHPQRYFRLKTGQRWLIGSTIINFRMCHPLCVTTTKTKPFTNNIHISFCLSVCLSRAFVCRAQHPATNRMWHCGARENGKSLLKKMTTDNNNKGWLCDAVCCSHCTIIISQSNWNKFNKCQIKD
jgi:hypothetical protein